MIDGNQHHARVAHMVGALSLVLSLASMRHRKSGRPTHRERPS